jgi:diguanylate cyclase (GGDEF)-like protein
MIKFAKRVLWRLGTPLKRIATLGNLGITPRLALAFASVAVLAATSHFIVENGVSMVQRARQADRPVPKMESRALRTQRAVLESVQARVTASQVVVALEKFDRAVREQAETGSADAAARRDAALAALKKASHAYVDQHEAAVGFAGDELQGAIRRHERTSLALTQVALERRGLLARYSTILARMKASLQQSLDKAWKIMGRVVARQSLLTLNTELDQIHGSFTAHGPVTTPESLAPLAAAEQAFSATLEKHAGALRRSQGEAWVTGLRNDFMQLSTARGLLTQVENRGTQLRRSFALETEQLAQRLLRAPPADARPGVANDTGEILATATLAAAGKDVAAAPQPVRWSATDPLPHRSLVAWLNFAVLAVLAYICLVTILSVVRPVRRLIAATTQLARGGAVTPVQAGGIRELDALSQAFNDMAADLSAARAASHQAQRDLEAKVEERTRELQHLAERDPLTGLANRRKLFAALGASIEEARQARCRVGAFVLDIDNFKTLNDSMGHAFGDRVLLAIAQRLEGVARSFGFAARLGGDEFMVVHEGADSIQEIEAAGKAIVQAFEEPMLVGSRELIVSASVGASVYPDHEEDAEALLRAADAALFRAKAMGRSQLTLFTPELLIAASAKFGIEQRLHRAIEKGEFELFFQPEVSVSGLDVSLVEALIRWRMPDGSYLGPGEFLGVAEESGLILEINDWVLRHALERAAQWHHGPWPEARVAINVSSRQFLDYRFVEKLRDLMLEFQLPARCVELELTESVLQTGPTTIRALEQLRGIGVAIALDDFGTGFSSIASLEQLPLTRIKLDRSLIARMDTSARSASIARATIGLCSELGLQVTAEGVERIEQFGALLGYRAMSLQGFLLAEPVPAGQLLPLLERIPAHCQELVLMSRAMPAHAGAAPADPPSGKSKRNPYRTH